MSSPVSFEGSVRKCLELGWTNRKIARELKTSPTTVQRVRTRINTGPHPVQPAGQAPPAEEPARGRGHGPAMLLAVALTVLAVIAAALIWARYLHPAASSVPGPQYTLCVQISPSGAVSGIAGGSDGSCPPRWAAIVLTPGH